MKIGVISLYSGDKFKEDTKYGRITIENYCNQHNYDLLLNNEDIVKSHDREIQWTKVLIIQKYLQYKKEGKLYYDYLVWIDADILILNPEKSIESFIDRLMNGMDLMYSLDWGKQINNGVMFIKNTPRILEYFREIWKPTGVILREQGRMYEVYFYNWNNCRSYIQITEDSLEYNTCWFEYKPDMFLVHFCGHGEPNRPQNSLRRMMNMFCPIKMDEDTEKSYQNRLNWLKNEAEQNVIIKKQICNMQGKYYPLDLEG